jgi:hypothetical protein
MSETVWLQTNTTALVNMAHVQAIACMSHEDKVVVVVYLTGADKSMAPFVIGEMKSLKAGQKFIKIIAELIKSNKKFIDTMLIADQVNASTESDV